MNRTMPLLATGFAAGLAGVLGLHPTGSHHALALGPTGATAPKPDAPARQPAAKPTPAAPAASAAPAGPSGVATARGPLEQYGYGQIVVSVTVSGHRILKVRTPTLQAIDSYSQSIANQAAPMLEQQVMQAQGSNIQGVSGASYTSIGFYRSLQGALHKLGL